MLTCLLYTLILAAPPPIAQIAEIDALSAARITDLTRFDAGLASADAAVVVATVHALGRLQTMAALPRLTAALAHPDWQVRQAAAFAWGQLEEAPAAPLMARIKADAAPGVRVSATTALGTLKDADWAFLREAATSDADHAVRGAALIALARQARRGDGVGHGFTLALPGWLADPNPRLRWAAAYAFRRATQIDGPTNFETALACAEDADPEARALCVRALGRFDDLKDHKQAALDTTLLKAANDPDWRVAVEAWRAAEQAKRLATLAPVLLMIPQASADFAGPRLHAWTTGLDALLKARSPQARPIAAAIFRLQPNTKAAPGVALGRAHLRCRAAAILDLDGGVRLATCDPAAPKGLVATLIGPVLAALDVPARAQAIVKRYAAAKTPAMRIALLDAAGALKGQSALIPIVSQGVRDPDNAVFSQAATTAGKLGIKPVGEVIRARLAALLTAQDFEAAAATMDALGALEDRASESTLRALITFPNHTIADHASKALAALGVKLPARPAPRDPKPVLRPTAKAAVISTTKGSFTLDLFSADAPLTVQSFVQLAEKGFYDGLLFHRVVGDFVVQGGDPRGDGWGGPGYTIPCEINPRRYHRGAVGMALAGKDTGGSQWFVTHAPQPHLDGRYTVFGQVRTFDVVDALAVGDRILKVTIQR